MSTCTSMPSGCGSKTCSIPTCRSFSMTIRRVFGAWITLALATGCASVQMTPQASIARLEQQRAADPKSVPVMRALGVQYYKQQRYAEARAALTQAAAVAPNDGVIALYLGLSAEGM